MTCKLFEKNVRLHCLAFYLLLLCDTMLPAPTKLMINLKGLTLTIEFQRIVLYKQKTTIHGYDASYRT